MMVRAVGDDDNDDDHEHDSDALAVRLAAWQHQVAQLPRFEHPGRSYLLAADPLASPVTWTVNPLPLAPGKRWG